MNEKTLLNLINSGESENLELKSTFNKEVIETLVSFANSREGYLTNIKRIIRRNNICSL